MAHDIARASLYSFNTSLVFFDGVDLGHRKSFLATQIIHIEMKVSWFFSGVSLSSATSRAASRAVAYSSFLFMSNLILSRSCLGMVTGAPICIYAQSAL